MKHCARSLILLAVFCVAAQAGLAAAQKPPSAKTVYDQYEPTKMRRGRAQGCLRGEEEAGAYCVKLCQRGYLLVPGIEPPRCRSIDPLPSGALPGPMQRDYSTQSSRPPKSSTPPRKTGP